MLWWELDPGSVILQKKEQSLELSDATLIAKAEALAADMKLEDFSASKGWADNFKKRHGIRGFRLHGEAESADLERVKLAREKLPLLIEEEVKAHQLLQHPAESRRLSSFCDWPVS